MPEPESPYVRVTDRDTGHRLTVHRSALPHGNYAELKQDAVDVGGNPLPPEHDVVKASSTSGQQADTPKEKSDG